MTLTQIGAASILLAATGIAEAQSPEKTVCTKEGQERRIEVHYPMQQPLPCEVHYHKYGKVEVLWKAEFSEGYCTSQAQQFIAEQRSWGWQCEAEGDAVEDDGMTNEVGSDDESSAEAADPQA